MAGSGLSVALPLDGRERVGLLVSFIGLRGSGGIDVSVDGSMMMASSMVHRFLTPDLLGEDFMCPGLPRADVSSTFPALVGDAGFSPGFVFFDRLDRYWSSSF